MTRIATTLGLLSLCTFGCGAAAHVSPVTPEAPPAAPARTAAVVSEPETLAPMRNAGRAPGDFVVYRFSGKLKARPLLLTERVVAQEGDVATIDYTLRDGRASQTMRVRMAGNGSEQKVVSAALVEGDLEASVSTDAFDALIAKTVVAADGNDGVVDHAEVTVDVGGKGILCEQTRYRVHVAKRDAILTVLHSDGFGWGDVGGEIRTQGGELLYKAELVGAGNGADANEIVAQRQP